MESVHNNWLIVALVGGMISIFIGGILLRFVPPRRNRSSNGYFDFQGERGCAAYLFRLFLLGIANVIMIGVLLVIIPSDAVDFGIPVIGIIIKIGFLLLANALLIAEIFYGIEL